jgi:hypothetical protein
MLYYTYLQIEKVSRKMEYITGAISLQAIFILYWAAYCIWYQGEIREAVYENVEKIKKCRTPQLGYHLYLCPDCLSVRLIPHSCKSRFCSSCGKIATDRWTDKYLSEILPVGYHHLVFTIPWQLRAICLENRAIMLNLMFSAASLSLQSWTREYGGYIPGIYIVLHTFGSDLKFNPHLHIIITAGGLSVDHGKWIHAPQDFLIPHKGLKKRWKYNVIKGLIDAHNRGLLQMPYLPKKEQYLNLRGIISVIAKLYWYINIGARLAEVGMTVKYIGRYTKKPVIAETRIISCNARWVIFRYKDYAKGGKSSVKKMGTFTFITYLVQHIPDKYFRNVRGYGLFSNRLRADLLPKARTLLNQPERPEEIQQKNWRERNLQTHGKDPLVCDRCSAQMVLILVCFAPEDTWLPRIGISLNERIPSKQLQINDTS